MKFLPLWTALIVRESAVQAAGGERNHSLTTVNDVAKHATAVTVAQMSQEESKPEFLQALEYDRQVSISYHHLPTYRHSNTSITDILEMGRVYFSFT